MRNIIVITLTLLLSVKAIGQLSVSWPIDKAVFQRNTAGNAIIIIAGQTPPTAWVSTWQLQYQIEKLTKTGALNFVSTSWTNIPTPGLGKVFRVSITQPTGWYRLTVRLMDGTNQIGSYALKFGVGEVFVIAGQSNAAGEGVVNYSDGTNTGVNHDCIITSAQSYSNKCSGKLPVYPVLTNLNKSSSYISPNGFQPWVYNYLATKIVDANGNVVVPVMVFNTGLSGTSSDDWSVTANDPTVSRSFNFNNERCTQNGNGFGQGEPFRSLRNSLNYYGSLFGVRGVIWHQGESDTFNDDSNPTGYTSTTYLNNLNNVISKTRTYYSPNLLWYVSNVSLFIKNVNQAVTSSDVLTGQNSVRTGNSTLNLMAANNSDGRKDWSFSGNGNIPAGTSNVKRQTDYQHFEMSGLADLGTQYNTNISGTFTTKASIPANPIVPVTFTQSGSSKTVSLDFASIGKSASNFSCFFWTTGDDYTAVTYPSYVCSSVAPYNGTSLTVSSNGQWRCYMRETSTGNVYMTQKLTVNISSSVRVAASEPMGKVYPNPTFVGFENTIEFKLDHPANVKLELVDETGKLIKELANSIHDAGDYRYPFSLNSKSFKTIDQLYYRLTIDDMAETRKIILY